MKRLIYIFVFLAFTASSFSQHAHDHDQELQCIHQTRAYNAGIFDPNYVWQSELLFDYDVKFYWLDIEVTNTSVNVVGNTTINAEAVVAIDTFAFELIYDNTIDSVFVDGVKYTNWQRIERNVLVPISQIPQGNNFSAQIYYEAIPPSGGFFAGVTHSTSAAWNKEVTWTLSEPFNAADWFPVKQDLQDKADSCWVFLTTDSDNMAGSQGILTNTVNLGNGKSRYEWKSSYPIDYYLISFAVSEYQEYNTYAHPAEMNGDSILIQNYIYDSPGCLENYKEGIDATGEMVELMSEKYILYPFHEEKYGHCLTQLGGGMEHQTMTTMGGFSFGLVAHELGHMWFGDNVTCATWSDIWINEGFATYSNALAEEFINGPEYGRLFIVGKQTSAMGSPGGSVYIPEEEIYPGNEYRIFNGRLSYNKGAAIIHILRHEIQDDEVFFDIMGTFQEDFTDSTATGEDFRNTAEEVSGMDFEAFFDQWYYGEGYPTYALEWYYDNGIFHLSATQTTSTSVTPFFEMLMDYQLEFEDGTDTIIHLYHTENLQNFLVQLPKKVVDIEVDPNDWTMEKVSSISVLVEETDSPVYFSVAPNPVQDQLNIYFANPSMGLRNISITDISGRVIQQLLSSDSQIHLNTASLSQGVYVVRVADGMQQFDRRFVK